MGIFTYENNVHEFLLIKTNVKMNDFFYIFVSMEVRG